MKPNRDYTAINSVERSSEHVDRFMTKNKILKTSKNFEKTQKSEQSGAKLK